MGTTVLLADDSITIQKVVGIIFANEDYELVVVDNGNSALEKARELKPSVMLVDALMPDMSGYDVCAEIRRDPALKNTPLLLLVGAFEPFEEEKARTSGIDDHITKPFESQNLLEKVHALLDLGATRSAAAPAIPEEAEPSFAGMPLVEEPPAAEAATSANLIEPFRGFIHLGSEETGGMREAAAVPQVETSVPAEADTGPEGIIVLSSVDIVEAGPDDDPWGTFGDDEQICYGEALEEDREDLTGMVEEVESVPQMDEQVDVAEIRLEEPAEVVEAEAGNEMSTTAADEPLVFPAEGESTAFSGFAPSEPLAGEPHVSEKIFLGDVTEATTVSPSFETAETDFDEFQLPADAALPDTGPEFGFAPDEAYVPVSEVLADAEPAPAVVTPAGEATPITLSEDQLATVISQVSREIIEKIAWDVVPDLAETIIREEIRKIKEGIGR